MLQQHYLFNVLIVFNTGAIADAWKQFGVAGNTEDVAHVIDVLSGQGECYFCCLFLLILSFFIATGKWPKTEISNKDVIRLQLACDVMKIDARQSIYYTALKAFGNEGVNTHMYATVFHFMDFHCAYSLH